MNIKVTSSIKLFNNNPTNKIIKATKTSPQTELVAQISRCFVNKCILSARVNDFIVCLWRIILEREFHKAVFEWVDTLTPDVFVLITRFIREGQRRLKEKACLPIPTANYCYSLLVHEAVY